MSDPERLGPLSRVLEPASGRTLADDERVVGFIREQLPRGHANADAMRANRAVRRMFLDDSCMRQPGARVAGDVNAASAAERDSVGHEAYATAVVCRRRVDNITSDGANLYNESRLADST